MGSLILRETRTIEAKEKSFCKEKIRLGRTQGRWDCAKAQGRIHKVIQTKRAMRNL